MTSRGNFDKHRSNTLYNEIGTIRLYRVSEETRKKVSEQTKAINEEMVQYNLESRKRFHREENERIRAKEEFRNSIKSKWIEKSKNSPLGVDQWREEEKRMERLHERMRQKKIFDDKVKLVASMQGKSENIYGKTTLQRESLPEETKLALRFQQSLLDEEVIEKEKTAVDRMLYDELDLTMQKFPVIVERTKGLDPMNSPNRRKKSSSIENNSFSDIHSSKRDHHTQSGSVSTGFSGPLHYTSPQTGMRILADELSEKFSETQIDLL